MAESLKDAHHQLDEQIKWWGVSSGHLAVVDTSVFMHHQFKIREIDFGGEIGARSEPVRLVVPLIVVDELDRLKSTGSNHGRWRAAHTLGVLDELLRTPSSIPTLRDADPMVDVAGEGMPEAR